MTAKKSATAKTKKKTTAAAPKKASATAKKASATAKKATAKKATAKKATAKKATTKKATATTQKATAKKATATAKKATATAKKATAKKSTAKKVAAAPAKKVAAATAPAKKVAAAAPAKKVAAAPAKKKAPAKKAAHAAAAQPRPSERAMAVAAQLPQERPLTDEEREAMAKVAQTALAALETDGIPEIIVTRIGSYVDEVRTGQRPEPNSQDVRLGLGVLWGEQVRAQVGWRWVHLSYPNGFASYALVPDDRAFACFPLNRLAELMTAGADVVNTSVPLFDSIRVGQLPARRENAYLVIG